LEFPVATLFAFNPLSPIVGMLHGVLEAIFGVVHNYGWSLIILAGLVKLVFWPLNSLQFKSQLKMQEVAPKVKALQAKYKGSPEKLNAETMALYKETGANPFMGCLPLLLQMPILISLYWAVISDKSLFASQTWLWIGSAFSRSLPSHVLATSLAAPDYVLLAAYVVSMYFSVRFTTPASDPQMAQQQKIMAFVSPAMVGFLGFKYAWPSALIIYWLSFNVFSMAQQLYLINKYHRNPSDVGPHPEAALATTAKAAPAAVAGNGVAAKAAAPAGARPARKRRSSRR
jgi:YidC/Oxa1 family membrane protein insertase